MNPLVNFLLTCAGLLDPFYGAALWLAAGAGLLYRMAIREGK